VHQPISSTFLDPIRECRSAWIDSGGNRETTIEINFASTFWEKGCVILSMTAAGSEAISFQAIFWELQYAKRPLAGPTIGFTESQEDRKPPSVW
jgi:hypothetical protein